MVQAEPSVVRHPGTAVVPRGLSAPPRAGGGHEERAHDDSGRRRLRHVERVQHGLVHVGSVSRCHRSADAPTQETQKSWRRPIFPKGCPLSIFGAGELNFRVRDGNGCGLSARVTRISCVWFAFRQRLCSAQERSGRRKRDLQLRVVWASKNAQVDPDPRRWPLVSVGKVKPSTISTAWLHPLPGFHVPPIKQVVSLRSYPVYPVGNLISRRASHLDAFSAYPNRT